MDRDDILDVSEKVEFGKFSRKIEPLINQYVVKNRQERWLYLLNKPKKFANNIAKLWDHLDTARSDEFIISNLPDTKWIYLDWYDDLCYLIETDHIEYVCLRDDGIAVSVEGKTAILFTHEDENFVFNL